MPEKEGTFSVRLPLWSGRRLISLWQMIVEFPVVQFWWLSHELKRLEELVRELAELQMRVISTQPREFDTGLAAEIKAAIDFAEPHCKNLEFQDTAMLPLYNIRAALQRVELLRANAPDSTSGDIRRDLSSLRKTIEMELQKRRFVYVSPEKTKFFAKDQIFGSAVYDAFPSARFDLGQAGDSVACGLDSAAAFHLMRAAEIGLWELGKDRQIPSVATIESMDWGDIIRELEIEVKKIQQWPNSPAKEDAHQFYNRSLVEIRAFNDGWRRHIAHVRKSQVPMDETEAVALVGHVERFLKTLASKIEEGKYTQLVWTFEKII